MSPLRWRALFERPVGRISNLVISPDGTKALVGKSRKAGDRGPVLLSIEDGTTRYLEDDFVDQTVDLAISPDGRYGSAVGGQFLPQENHLKVWDLETLELVAVHDPETKIDLDASEFTYDNDLLWADTQGLHRWNFRTGEHRLVFPGDIGHLRASADGRIAVPAVKNGVTGDLTVIDLVTGEETPITTHGDTAWYDVDPTGQILATLTRDGVLRVGPITGEEPHRAQVDIEFVQRIRVDPLGRWVAIVTRQETVLWPIPDLDEPPFHTLPHDRVVAELEAMTNYRLVADPESSSGWGLEWTTFPGWEDPPSDSAAD